MLAKIVWYTFPWREYTLLRFAEELLVLTVGAGNRDPIPIPERTESYALAGAVLLDLALEHRIDTDLRALHVINSTPVGDSLLDPVLAEIVREPSILSPESWIRRIAGRYAELRELTLDRLVAADILESDDGGVFSLARWVSRSERYPAKDGKAEQEIQTRMMATLLSDDIPSPRDSLIIALANACGVFRFILEHSEYERIRERLELISRLELVARTVIDSVRTLSLAESQRLRREIRKRTGGWPKASGRIPLLGHAVKLVGDINGFFTEQYLKHGPVFEVSALGRRYVVMAGQQANLFMIRQGRLYLRSQEQWEAFRKSLGASRILPGLDGTDHRLLRRTKRDGYSRNFILKQMPQAVSVIEQELTELPLDRPLPVFQFMQRVTTEQITLLSANTSSRDYIDELVSFNNAMHSVFLSRRHPKFMMRMPRMRRAVQRLELLVERVLAEHESKTEASQFQDLIDNLIELHRIAPDSHPETDMFIAALGPFLVGLDTVAPTISFALYSLLKHPDLLKRVTREADEFFACGNPTPEGIRRMTVTQGVIMETLRMFSVAPGLQRTVSNTFEFGGYYIPAGTQVLIANCVPHRLPEFFPEPDSFDIDRYSPLRREHARPGVFAPFGLGHHGCLGRGFAEVQMVLSLATLLHRARIDLAPADYRLKTRHFPTLRPDGNFKIRLQRRQRG